MLGSKITLLANLQSVERRKPTNNIQVLKLDVVTHTFHKKADGSWTNKQEHHYPLVFGKMVEHVEKNATKGKLVLIEGIVSYPKGRPKEIIANEIRFLNAKEAE